MYIKNFFVKNIIIYKNFQMLLAIILVNDHMLYSIKKVPLENIVVLDREEKYNVKYICQSYNYIHISINSYEING